MYDWYLKILLLMQIVQINTARLDRLSAILEGVAPVFSVLNPNEPSSKVNGHDTKHQTPPSLVVAITPSKALEKSAHEQNKSSCPSLWIGHLSHWNELQAAQGSGLGEFMCIRAQLTGPLGALLMEEFAQSVLLRTDIDEPALSLPLALIQQEIQHPRCGQPALLKSAGDILFVGILRNLVANPKPDRPGLLMALSDARIAKALIAMHQAPHLDWNLFSLALEAGMSRTSFATTFKKAMAKSPGKYLVALRLALARRAMESGKTVKEAAKISGYRNPGSLARALK